MRKLTRRAAPVCLAQLGGQPEPQGSATSGSGEPALGGDALKHLTELERVKELQRRKRISDANKGRTPWNKGRRHSPETIAKIRAGTTKAMARPEVRAKLEAFNETQRRPHDEETKAKIRAVLQERSRATRQVIAEQCHMVMEKMEASEDPAMREAAAFPEAHALLCSLAWSFMKKDWGQLAEKWDSDAEFRERGLQRIRSRMIKIAGDPQRGKARNKVRVAMETLARLREAKAKMEQAEAALANLRRVKAALAADPARQRQAAAAEGQAQIILEKLRGQVDSLTTAMGPLAKYLTPGHQGDDEHEEDEAGGPGATEEERAGHKGGSSGGGAGGGGGGPSGVHAPQGPSILGSAGTAAGSAGTAGGSAGTTGDAAPAWPGLAPKMGFNHAISGVEPSNGALQSNGTVSVLSNGAAAAASAVPKPAAAAVAVAVAPAAPQSSTPSASPAALPKEERSPAQQTFSTPWSTGGLRSHVPNPALAELSRTVAAAPATAAPAAADVAGEGPAPVRSKVTSGSASDGATAGGFASSNGAAPAAGNGAPAPAPARQQLPPAGANGVGSGLGVSSARPATIANVFSWSRPGQGAPGAGAGMPSTAQQPQPQPQQRPPSPALQPPPNGIATPPLAGRTLGSRAAWGPAGGASAPLRPLGGSAGAVAAAQQHPHPPSLQATSAPGLEARVANGGQAWANMGQRASVEAPKIPQGSGQEDAAPRKRGRPRKDAALTTAAAATAAPASPEQQAQQQPAASQDQQRAPLAEQSTPSRPSSSPLLARQLLHQRVEVGLRERAAAGAAAAPRRLPWH